MRKRLRKKLRLGEFQEMGFPVRFRIEGDLTRAGQDAFFDSFISEAIEGNGLMCGGACGATWDVFVTRHGRGSATEDDRRNVQRWLTTQPRVRDINVGTLMDAWHTTRGL